MRRLLGWLGPAASVLMLTSCGSSNAPPIPPPRAADPAFVVEVAYTHRDRIDVRSGQDGRTIRSLGYFGDDLGGEAITADGHTAYLQFIDPFRIVRVDLADGRRQAEADGYGPSVSSDGKEMAYLSGGSDSRIFVRDLSSHATRSLDLSRWVDDSGDLFNGRMIWLAKSTTLAVIPADSMPQEVASTTTASRAERPHGCGDRSRTGCVILISGPRSGPLRYERRITALHLDTLDVAAIASDAPQQLILAINTPNDTARIGTISLTGGASGVTPRYVVSGATAEVFDSSGTHLIYANSRDPAQLIEAAIGARGLLDRRVLVPQAREVQASGW